MKPVACCLVVALAAGCDSPTGPKAHTPIQIRPAFIDVGTVRDGKAIVRFEVTNTGNRPLTCKSVAATCSCAGFAFDTLRDLEPGETRVCTGTIMPEPGRLRVASVILEFEGLPPTTAHVRARGARLTGVQWNRRVDLGTLMPGRTREFDLSVKVDAHAPIKRDRRGRIEYTAWYVNRSTAPLRIVNSGRRRRDPGTVELWCRGEVSAPYSGRGEASLELRLGSIGVDFSVYWDARFPARIDHEILVLGPKDGRLAGQTALEVDTGWRLLGCSPNDKHLSVSTEASGKHRFRVSVLAPRAWAEHGKADVTVRLLDPGGKEFVLPLRVVCMPRLEE